MTLDHWIDHRQDTCSDLFVFLLLIHDENFEENLSKTSWGQYIYFREDKLEKRVHPAGVSSR
jgi:hypothetical protein